MKRQLVTALLLATIGAGATAAPEAWFLAGDRSKSYEIGEDSGSGKPVRYIRHVQGEANAFGTLMQAVSAKNYQGKRVRFQAMIKTHNVSDWAGCGCVSTRQASTAPLSTTALTSRLSAAPIGSCAR